MKRYLTLLLVFVSLCFAASALAAPRAGQKPSFGSQNFIKDAEETMKDVNNSGNSNAKHGIVHGRVRIYGYKDEIRKPVNRFEPYAVFPNVRHVEDRYLEYYYIKLGSDKRVWEICVIDGDGKLQDCEGGQIQIHLPYPSIWSAEKSIYWKWTDRYARKHYEWDYALGEIYGYGEVHNGGAWAQAVFFSEGPYHPIKETTEFGPCIELRGRDFGYYTAIFIKNTKK